MMINKYFILILILMCSTLVIYAQTNIETSAFVNVPVATKLYPLPKTSAKKSNSKISGGVNILTEETPLDFDLKIDCYHLPDGSNAVFFTARIDNKELGFENVNQVQVARVEIFARITSLDKKAGGMFADKIVFSVNDADANIAVATNKQSYVKGVSLPSGNYRINFFVHDLVTGKISTQFPKFTVPSL